MTIEFIYNLGLTKLDIDAATMRDAIDVFERRTRYWNATIRNEDGQVIRQGNTRTVFVKILPRRSESHFADVPIL